LDRSGEGFDAVVSYSFLHHLPGRDARRAFLREAAGLLATGGTFVISVWQFGHLERFRKRVVDPADVGVDPGELEPGDTILDWQRGGRCFRYVHEYGETELDEDLASAGLNVLRRYHSDGETGNLGLYSELQHSSVR
jgi:SAM-dependent methyltransferase